MMLPMVCVEHHRTLSMSSENRLSLVYYRQMAEISRFEFYNPKKGEVSDSLSD